MVENREFAKSCCSGIFSSVYQLPCVHLWGENRVKLVDIPLFYRLDPLHEDKNFENLTELMAREIERLKDIAKAGTNTASYILNKIREIGESNALNPAICNPKGRPKGSKGKKGNFKTPSSIKGTLVEKRDPSAFEYIEKQQPIASSPKKTRNCSFCHLPGHNIRSCPSK
jgi:hypothetical protein